MDGDGFNPLTHEDSYADANSRASQGTTCDVCGDIGFRHLLLFGKNCKGSATHRYCLKQVVFDASLNDDWSCDECQKRNDEVTCSESAEGKSSGKKLTAQPASKRAKRKGQNATNVTIQTVTATSNQPSPVIVNCLGYRLGDIDLLKARRCRKSKKEPSPLKGLVEKGNNAVLGSKVLEMSSPTTGHGNSILERDGESNFMQGSGENSSSKHTDHNNKTSQTNSNSVQDWCCR